MGTQQSRSGHGRQGSQQQGQQTERRPEQDRDLQRNKQSDRSQQQHRQGGGGRGQQQASGSGSGQSAPSGQMQERQQSQLGGNRDFTHKMENENREQQNMRREQSQQNVHGEGNYAASKQYDDATKDYAKSGRAEPAARAAAPKSDADARAMDAAEAEGKRHAKGEDPALSRRASPSGEASETPRPGHEEQ